MTPTATDSRTICRVQLTGEGRWVSLALSLDDTASGTRFLVRSEPLLYEMIGVDDAAREYGLANWQGGVISGARYAFRALKAPIRQVQLHELRGQLSSGDVGAVSSAAALAVSQLLGRPSEVPMDLGGWTRETEERESGCVSARAARTGREPLSPFGQHGVQWGSAGSSGRTRCCRGPFTRVRTVEAQELAEGA
jgi:hypothetical protein